MSEAKCALRAFKMRLKANAIMRTYFNAVAAALNDLIYYYSDIGMLIY